MAEKGFLEQKPASPLSFGAVLLLHGAAIAAAVLIKGPDWTRHVEPPLVANEIELDKPPPPEPVPEPDPQKPQTPSLSRLDVPPRVVDTPVPSIPADPVRTIPGPIIGADPVPQPGAGTRPLPEPQPVPQPIPDPVRVEAQFDPRFAREMQPPYPLNEERAEREGEVRIKVTIGADGRVKAAEKVSATSDSFWRSTERQALSRWRFRPATIDGRPVQTSKVLNVRFRLDGR